MNKYTQDSSIIAQTTVQTHLDVIVNEIRELFKNDIESIVLTGGFGRDEGSVVVHNGECHIVNDYDFQIICKNKVGIFVDRMYYHFKYKSRLDSLGRKLSQQYKIKQIDLDVKSCAMLNVFPPKLSDYDLRHGSALLYGNSVDNLIQDYKAKDITRFEGLWLLKNRGIGLILAYLYIETNQLNYEYINIELNKAILAMGDSLLIVMGKYESSYRARKKIITEIDTPFDKFESLKEAYILAVDQKVRTDKIELYKEVDSRTVNSIIEIYVDFYKYLLNHHFQCQQFDFSRRLSLEERLRIFMLIVKTGCSFNEAELKFQKFPSVEYTFILLESILTGKEELITEYISCHRPLRESLVKFISIVHPGGEAGRMING